MARHLLPLSERTRRIAVLGGALAIGLVGYSIVSVDDGADRDRGDDSAPATSEPTVLGAVITSDDVLPAAAPAAPVSISDGATESPVTTSAPAPPGSTPATSPPATAPPATSPPPTTAATQPPPTLVPPTVVENTTTTAPPSTTTEPPPDPEPSAG